MQRATCIFFNEKRQIRYEVSLISFYSVYCLSISFHINRGTFTLHDSLEIVSFRNLSWSKIHFVVSERPTFSTGIFWWIFCPTTKKGCYVACFAVVFWYSILLRRRVSSCDMENWLDLGVLLPLWLTAYLTLFPASCFSKEMGGTIDKNFNMAALVTYSTHWSQSVK